MNNYQKQLEEEVLSFKKKAESKTLQRFTNKIRSTNRLTRDLDSDEHICVFFLPYNRESRSIFLVNHIKANSWIPPGGHIEQFEDPKMSVLREFEEELGHKIDIIQISPYAMTVIDISDNKRNTCKKHYDFWYLVNTPIINYKYLKREFYEGRWFKIDDACKIISVPLYVKTVRSLCKQDMTTR